MRNLQAEMVRYGVRIDDLQTVLECTEKTVRNKLSGVSEFSYPEAEKIRNELFAGFRLEYLFADEQNDKAS